MRNFTKLLMLFVLCLVGMQGNAQNVTVHPDNGSMIATKKTGGGDTFFNWGGFSTWKHEQLTLTMTTGDSDNNLTNTSNQLTASGQLANHANDIFSTGGNGTKYLQMGKGNEMDTYVTIALPKGYRFRGYTIMFHRINRPNGAQTSWLNPLNEYTGGISFGETNISFDYRTTTNTTATNITPYRGGINQNNTDRFTIGRTSQNDTDMGNVLYFRLSNGKRDGRAFIQFDHIELLFTAEADYAPITPTTSVSGQSAVDISFITSKMNYGQLTPQTDGGSARISYNGAVSDLNANLTLYEEGSVEAVSDNGFDGTAGNIVKHQNGSITSAGDFFKLESSKHNKPLEDGEAIYYIETPIWVTSGTGTNTHRDPIGYRIVGATFDYAAGTDHTYYPATFNIRYESTGHGEDQDGIYGLNHYSGQYNWNYQTAWRIDQEGYIYFGKYYLAVNGTSIDVVDTNVDEKPSADVGTFEVVENDGIKQIRRKNSTTEYIGWVETETTNDEGVTTFVRSAVITETENNRSYYDELTPSGGGTTGKYTLRIYTPDGTEVLEERIVEGTGGSVTVSGYNNDAIKIGIVGTGLINGHLTLQALDPYIDHIDIVCQENSGNGGKLTQQFNATDFSVRGGKFTFYVPEDFQAPVKFTFENLYSKYGDKTYYGNTASTDHARYYFLGSEYSGYENNDVYKRYNNTSYRDADYTTKIACTQPGNKKFTFNNAATVGTQGGYYQEYPFSIARYTAAGGQFTDFMFNATEITNGVEKTAYLFTCDETRYNIAPTTAIQHVYYAYYEMTIDMKKKTYQPIFTWTKVYDNTCYNANNTDTDQTDAMYGLRVTTTPVEDDQGIHSGYVTVSQITNKLTSDLAAGGTNVPSRKDQILYIDGSNLMNIVENQTTTNGTTTTHRLSELMTGLAKNALIYLPYGSTSNDNNFAFNTIAQYGEDPIFRGAGNIVLTDKIPFFAKYNIQVDAANYATYKRKITRPENGKVMNATLMLPFGLSIEGDKARHTNDVGEDCVFTINELKNVKTFAIEDGTKVDYGVGYFVPIQANELGMSEANMPYMVKVESYADGEASFVATQKGATIVATPNANYVRTLPSVTMSTGQALTNEATYSGKLYQRDDGENVLYFANNMFMDLHTLVSYRRTLYMYPFRSVYTYTGGGANTLRFMEVSYDDELTDGIQKMPANADLMVRSGNGVLQLEAQRGQTVTVRSLDGIMVNSVSMNAGDSKVINLPAGVYIVNNVKIIVK